MKSSRFIQGRPSPKNPGPLILRNYGLKGVVPLGLSFSRACRRAGIVTIFFGVREIPDCDLCSSTMPATDTKNPT